MTLVNRLSLALGFSVVSPLVTFGLLWAKGLPDFAEGHLGQVILWVYSVTWVSALVAGVLLSAILSLIVSRTSYFHQPFDFGRSFSLGSVLGSLIFAGSTMAYRAITHHPFSNFWVAGALIAGSMTGAALVVWELNLVAKRSTRIPRGIQK